MDRRAPYSALRMPDGRPPHEDDELVARLRRGEEEAFRALIRRHHVGLIRFAQNFVSTAASAEELVQETWISVLDGIDRFEGRSRLKTWIYGILANQARRRAVREERMTPLSALAVESVENDDLVDRFGSDGRWLNPPSGQDLTPEEDTSRQETARRLERALEQLPDRLRRVVTLRDVEELSSEEVAVVLGLTEGNVRVLLHRARIRLRNILAHDPARGAAP